MNNLKIYIAFIGTASIAAIQTLQAIPLDEIIKVLTQLAVAIVTVWHLFKKNGGSNNQVAGQ